MFYSINKIKDMVSNTFATPQDAISAGMGFIGLGAMGKHMAGHIAKYNTTTPLKVWNRTTARAEEHAVAYGSVCVTDFSAFNDCGVVFLSLPTTA